MFLKEVSGVIWREISESSKKLEQDGTHIYDKYHSFCDGTYFDWSGDWFYLW